MNSTVVEKSGFLVEEVAVPVESQEFVLGRWRVVNAVSGKPLVYVARMKQSDGTSKLVCNHCQLRTCPHIAVVDQVTRA